MKNKILTATLIVCLSLMGINNEAYDFKKGRIYYKILSDKDSTVSVDAGQKSYKGVLIIPSHITYRHQQWTVTSMEKKAFSGSDDLRYLELPFKELPEIDSFSFPPKTYQNLWIVGPCVKGVKYWEHFSYNISPFENTSDEDIDRMEVDKNDIPSVRDEYPQPKIVIGKARISGFIRKKDTAELKRITVTIGIREMFSDMTVYSAPVDNLGHFALEIPMMLDKQTAILSIKNNGNDIYTNIIGLNQDKEVSVEDDVNGNVTIKGGFGFTKQDGEDFIKAANRDHYIIQDLYVIYHLQPNDYARHKLKVLDDYFDFMTYTINPSQKLSNWFRRYLWVTNVPKYFYHYHEDIMRNQQDYYNQNQENLPDTIGKGEPDKSYYCFLNNLNLNDSRFLYENYMYMPNAYYHFLLDFLHLGVFNIPKIDDMPIDLWKEKVKRSVRDVIDVKDGFFYDMLAATALAAQMKEECTPLTERQKKNIIIYYHGRINDMPSILLKLNDDIPQKLKERRRLDDDTIQHTLQTYSNDIIDSIANLHSGRVTLIDIWDTWCGPCMNAHRMMRDIKDSLRNAGVDFVYISDDSSPYKIWKEYIKDIGDEQYYITQKRRTDLLNKYHLDGVPAYLIFDRHGKRVECFTGFPGQDIIKQKLVNLIK